MMTRSLENVTTAQSDFESLFERARHIDARAIITHGVGNEEPAVAALALLDDSSIPTRDIQAAAAQVTARRSPQLRTWVPLYLTNHCDAGCKMCGMRRNNSSMVRHFPARKRSRISCASCTKKNRFALACF